MTNLRINLKAQATALVLLASTPSVLANPLTGIMGTEGACDTIEVNVESSSSSVNEAITDNDSVIDDILGYDKKNDYTENYESSDKATAAYGASRNCKEAREWLSEELNNDRKHQSKERNRDRNHQFQNNLLGTGVNLLGGLFQHSQNQKADRERQATEARANRQLQQQAEQIEALRREIHVQRQSQSVVAPAYPLSNVNQVTPNNYHSTQIRGNAIPVKNTLPPSPRINPYHTQLPHHSLHTH